MAVGSDSSRNPTAIIMVQLSTIFVTLSAAACALAGSVPAKRQTSPPQCAVDTVQYLFWLNNVQGSFQSSSSTVLGAEGLAIIGVLDQINFELVGSVATGSSVANSGFLSNIGPFLDEANRLATALNSSSALTALANAQDAVKSITADCN
ncbi:hypothetical protein B0H11DRAFT_1994254 [Mycena galericulata]|nr:hypothetical protein B0H11DRAFT_2205683 [Mycena galericulata]KAJ7500740.1 hypothetical protein B0H11DRAFT_1994254 [Mycena galericulata]